MVIARTDTEYCPVTMLERYMQLANISMSNPSKKSV